MIEHLRAPRLRAVPILLLFADPPFADDRHDALDAADFRLRRYGEYGANIPLPLR